MKRGPKPKRPPPPPNLVTVLYADMTNPQALHHLATLIAGLIWSAEQRQLPAPVEEPRPYTRRKKRKYTRRSKEADDE